MRLSVLWTTVLSGTTTTGWGTVPTKPTIPRNHPRPLQCHAFTRTPLRNGKRTLATTCTTALSSSGMKFRMSSKHSFDDTAAVDLDDLREMDVVVFSDEPPTTQGTATNGVDSFSRPRRQLGAIQENGRIAPLCVWTLEPAFGDSLEFLVDEHALHNNNNSGNGGRDMRHVRIHGVVPHTAVSYGSRQVGGGMGPGNPHGEESEMLYYIEQSVLYNNNNKQAEGDDDGDLDIEIIVKPELEIFW